MSEADEQTFLMFIDGEWKQLSYEEYYFYRTKSYDDRELEIENDE